jgi:hypothetical protein
MSTITLTPVEFDLFKSIADFYFDFIVKTGVVHVMADAKSLASLGY